MKAPLAEPPPESSKIFFEADAQDIAGLCRLYSNENCGLSVSHKLSITDNGILITADPPGPAIGQLWGPRITAALVSAVDMIQLQRLIAPIEVGINGLGRSLDPAFGGIRAIGADVWDGFHVAHYSLPSPRRPSLGSSLGRHSTQMESMEARLNLIDWDEDAALIVETLAEPPSWTTISAAFETIKYSLDAHGLSTTMMTKVQRKEFGKSANNTVSRKEGGRHGKTAENQNLSFAATLELMTLNEAVELHRQVVNRYLDARTGHRTAYEICDWMTDKPRFGLSEYKHNLDDD